jgi:SAM-dependent methyltransferase
VGDLPPGLTDLLAEALRGVDVESGCHVVQLFGGGGELTQALVAFADRLIAVDRSEEKLQENFRRWPGVETATGTSEAIPLPDDSVDVVVVADPLELASASEPYGEIARVLRSGGALVVAKYGERWPEERDLLGDFEPLLVDRGRAGREDWRRGLEETGLFTTVVVTESDRDVDVGVDAFVALVGSWGWIADLPGEQRAAVLGAVRDLVGDRATVTVRYHIEVCAARAIGG